MGTGGNVSTWQDVKQYIYANYRVSADDGHLVTMEFQTTLGRSQVVHLLCGNGSSYISIFSPIGKVAQIDAKRLLQLSDGSGTKAMGIRQVGDMYMVVGMALLADLSGPELEIPMQWALEEADQYEQALGLGDQF